MISKPLNDAPNPRRDEARHAELQVIYEHAPIMMGVMDTERRLRYVNREMALFIGRSTADVTGATACGALGCINALDDPRGCGFGPNCPDCPLLRAIQNTLGTGHSHRDIECAMTVQRNGGAETVWLQASTALVETAQTPSVLLCLQNITPRKQALRDLSAKTAELDRFFSAALDLLCIADTTGQFLKLNPQWEQALGYRLAELEGTCFLDYVHPEDRGPTQAAIETLGRQHPVLNFINRYRHKDGSYRWIEWRSYPVENRIYAAARDITERRMAEAERRKMDQQIQQTQKLESLGVLAGGIAHDFNNILMTILGNAELALDDLSPLSPVRDRIGDIALAARRASELCRQMLAYAGRTPLSTTRVDLRELIDEMAHLLKSSISKKVVLNLTSEEGLPPIKADASQLRQIVMNLIVNASEAIGDRSGVVTVAIGVARYDAEDLRRTALQQDLKPGDYVFIEVTDTGCGIDETTRHRIFEPFFTTKEKGRGLGLAATLGIMRRHRGAMKVYSEVNKGTTFKLLFPAPDVSEIPPAVSGGDARGEAPWKGSGTVLVVDDEESLRTLCGRMLEQMGLSVLTAADGREAVSVYREKSDQIDLVIMDLTMPHMDGAQAFTQLRHINPGVRVILSSGYSEDDVAARFAGKGLVGVLQKPFSLKKMRALIKTALQSET